MFANITSSSNLRPYSENLKYLRTPSSAVRRSPGTILFYDDQKKNFLNKSDIDIYLTRILSVEAGVEAYMRRLDELKAQLTLVQLERDNAVKSFSMLSTENQELREYFMQKFNEASVDNI